MVAHEGYYQFFMQSQVHVFDLHNRNLTHSAFYCFVISGKNMGKWIFLRGQSMLHRLIVNGTNVRM